MTEKKKADRAEWRIHNLNTSMMLALEESGGEVTPAVEALEAEIDQKEGDLAILAVNLHAHCKGQLALCKQERARLAEAATYWTALKTHASRWLLSTATARAEAGETGAFSIGTFRVWTLAPRGRVAVRLPTNAHTGYVEDRAGLDPQIRRDLDALARKGFGRWDFKPDKDAVGKELMKGVDFDHFKFEFPVDRTVVVK